MSSPDSLRGAHFALTRNGNEIASATLVDEDVSPADQPVTVSELQPVGFSLTSRTQDVEYAVAIGDVPLPPGRAFGPTIYWEDGHHFESARGRVHVRLRARTSPDAGWRVCARLDVNVVPTKLGERRYETLVNDIRVIAAGLIFDIVSKMFRGVRYARGMTQVASHTSHLELANLRRQWTGISRTLDLITTEPQLCTGRCIELRSYSGAEVLSPSTAVRLAARGFDPRSSDRGRPVTVPAERLTRTGDIVEHRVILWFLQLLLQRVRECTKAARAEIALIESERELRDVAMGAGPTLYEEVDLPKIERLRESIAQAHELAAQLRRAMLSPLFRHLRPQAGPTDTPVFQHVDAYHRFGRRMRHYLTASLVVLEAGERERLKATSRLYEHWVFLRLAEAFRGCGLCGDDVEGVVRRRGRHRFVLDLDDDMALLFRADSDRFVRLRYEPWILPVEAARRRGDALCRGAGDSAPAWRPDVLVEFIDGGEVAYAVVVDSKYSARIQDHHWLRVEKYTQIRTVVGLRQVVRQVWLAHPGENAGIHCRDTTVTWTAYGPDRPRDEIVLGDLGLRPVFDEAARAEAYDEDEPSTVVREFAAGLLHYVGFLTN